MQSLGNHEFDDKIDGLLPFVQNVSYPIICANCEFEKYPKLKELILPYYVIEVGGRKIGIIGYLTTDSPVSFIQI